MSDIEIRCSTKDSLTLEELTPFQGSLKTLSPVDRDKLARKIVVDGFVVPFFVWSDRGTNYIIDGHQRDIVLRHLKDHEFDGEKVTMPARFPVVYIDAKSDSDARRILLDINSKYGMISEASLTTFMKDAGLLFDELQDYSFPEIDYEAVKASMYEAEQGLSEYMREEAERTGKRDDVMNDAPCRDHIILTFKDDEVASKFRDSIDFNGKTLEIEGFLEKLVASGLVAWTDAD
jgi:hypothetical protein